MSENGRPPMSYQTRQVLAVGAFVGILTALSVAIVSELGGGFFLSIAVGVGNTIVYLGYIGGEMSEKAWKMPFPLDFLPRYWFFEESDEP